MKLKDFLFPAIFLLMTFFLNVSHRLYYVIKTSLLKVPLYGLTHKQNLIYLGIYTCMLFVFLWIPIFLKKDERIRLNITVSLLGITLAIVGAFYCDVFYLYKASIIQRSYEGFITGLLHYLKETVFFYAVLIMLFISVSFIYFILCKHDKENFLSRKNKNNFNRFKLFYILAAILIPAVLIYPLPAMNLQLFLQFKSEEWLSLPDNLQAVLFSLYVIGTLSLCSCAYVFRKDLKLSISWIKNFTKMVGVIFILTVLYKVFITVLAYRSISSNNWQTWVQTVNHLKNELPVLSILAIMPLATSIFIQFLKSKAFDESAEAEQTSGNFGTAAWATPSDLEQIKAYDESTGPLMGVDLKGRSLYFPIKNKLTISPEGGGKTTSSSIPILLSHKGPVFAFDTKGELWAVTARYRTEVLGREIVVIDPFDVVKSNDFTQGKPDILLKKYKFNPFDWVPEDQRKRDRMINTFAASFVINQKGYHSHFDDNAKILIRGYIDYLMKLPPEERKLEKLYHLMSESVEEAQETFDQMAKCDGRAGAAANQISRVGLDEKGSILSTSYRQIDWLGDSNIQDALSESNFDLRDFLKGNMDIFVILPEDQVEEHNRLFRIIMSLLTSLIISAEPSELPNATILFLIEELAQLGATPDVQKCIEVLRARGIRIWAVFQTLKQIKMFEKPDLFLTMRLKQIFANDDPETMEWIQKLGGKKTIVTKTISKNIGDSRQATQVMGGTVSKGESESVHETGVDLIPLNEIRELPVGEQFIFTGSTRPIHCRQASYLMHPDFVGKFDQNPLENRNAPK